MELKVCMCVCVCVCMEREKKRENRQAYCVLDTMLGAGR